MTKSHAKSITVKGRSYGGSNFLADGLPDLVCAETQQGVVGCAIKTYEYQWSGKLATLEMCAQNWLVDRSYNRIHITSNRGDELKPLDYDITKDKVKIGSCTIGSVTYDPFEVCFAASTWYGPDELVETCYLYHNIYKKEDEYTNGYHLQFPWFGVPYCLKIGTKFFVNAGAKVIYRGTGTPSEQEFRFYFYEYNDATDTWILHDRTSVTASSGDTISYTSTEVEFKKDLTLYGLLILYYNPALPGTAAYYELYWRIKESDYNFHTSVDIYTEQP